MSAEIAAVREGDTLQLSLSGRWRLGESPTTREQLARFGDCRRLELRVAEDTDWDSSLPAFVLGLQRAAERREVATEVSAPQRLQQLLKLAGERPEGREAADTSFRWRLPNPKPQLRYIGALLLALRPGTRALPQPRELLRIAQQCSTQSLPIVLLVNFLVGGILAFIGAVQLRSFGAEIYVADMVAIATTREMAALITAVVLSGRLAAAFAAEIATMQGNEEIDALRTAGVNPPRYLAVPRVLALTLAMPFLFAAACLAGLGGGMTVAHLMLDIPASAYLLQSGAAVGVSQPVIGLIKAVAFAIFLGATGCYHGLCAARTAAAVGEATTRAVVGSIVGIICIDAFFAVVCNALGI